MNRMLLCGLTAVVGLAFLADVSDAGFRRRRSRGNCNNCYTANQGCQGCQAPYGGQQHDPNAAPPMPNDAPAAPQALNRAPGQQPNTTFYRGQNTAPPQQPQAPTVQNRTTLRGDANLNADPNRLNTPGQTPASARPDPEIANPGRIENPGAADQRSNDGGGAGGNSAPQR